MKRYSLLLIALTTVSLQFSCRTLKNSSFWDDGKPFFKMQELFADERFPNVVVGTDGTVIATWGRENFRVRRSEDGGQTWGPEITVANPGFQGGGTLVDENTGDILVFVEAGHPVAPLTVYRSRDQGKTWVPEAVKIEPNSRGDIPSMHMNEAGITLKKGRYAGRLIRATRFYDQGNDQAYWDAHYTNAMYSDDGGKTWQASEPFPAFGTGEAAIEELSDGSLYYNSRRHKSTDGMDPRRRYAARSFDGGRTWREMWLSTALPDGDQQRDYGLMGGLARLPIPRRDILLFTNIESEEGRHHGTIWASFDGGLSWPVKRLIDPGSFAYSSLAVGRKGTPSEGLIYLLYESDGGAKIARFNLDWVLEGHRLDDYLP